MEAKPTRPAKICPNCEDVHYLPGPYCLNCCDKVPRNITIKRNDIYNGDYLELLSKLEDNSVDMILTDPPYAVTSRASWDVAPDWEEMWNEFWRVLKKNGVIVMTSQQPTTTDLINTCGEGFKYSLVWKKNLPTGFLNAKKMPLRQHEDVLVFYREPPCFNPQMTQGHERKVVKERPMTADHYNKTGVHSYDSTDRYPTSILDFPVDNRLKAFHPTQKPVGLFKWLLLTYTNPGDLVVDPFAGSGTTGVAARMCSRDWICVERDKVFYGKARDRIFPLMEWNKR